MDKIDISRLPAPETYLLYLFACDGVRTVGELMNRFRFRFDREYTILQLDQLCRISAGRGWLRCTGNSIDVRYRAYAAGDGLTAAEFRYLRLQGIRNGWAVMNPGVQSLVVALLTGGKGFQLPKYQADYIFWEAGIRFLETVSAEFPVPAKMQLPLSVPDLMYRILTSNLFCRGLNLQPVLEDWRAHHLGNRFDHGWDAVEYAALCVWTGHLDWLDVDFGGLDATAGEFVGACRKLGDGDFAAAYKGTGAIDNYIGRDTGNAEEIIFTMPAANLLALMTGLVHKPTRTRTSRFASRMCPNSSASYYRLESCARSFFDDRYRHFADFRIPVDGMSAHPLGLDPKEHDDDEDYAAFKYRDSMQWQLGVAALSTVCNAINSGAERKSVERSAAGILEAATSAFGQGYPTVAGLYLGVFGWALNALDAEKTQRLAEGIRKQGGVWLRPYEASASPWRRIISELDRRLPASAHAAANVKAKGGRVVWRMLVKPDDWYGDYGARRSAKAGTMVCDALLVYFRGPRTAEDGSGDRPLTLKALASGKYDDIFTEGDREVIKALQRAEYRGLRGNARPPAEAIMALCGGDMLMFYDGDRYLDIEKVKPRPVTMVRRDLPLAVKSTADGGIELSVPKWCTAVNDVYALRNEDEDTLALYPFPKEARAVMDVFTDFGKDGKVAIPKEGMTALRPLLPRLAALTPLQGDLATVAAGAELPRVAGDAVTVARLEFDGETLAVVLRVLPLAGNRELVFVPGVGMPERMVAHNHQSVVLVRDLESEKANLAKVRSALEDFGSWADDRGDYRIDDFSAALGALVALKDLGDAVRIEWRREKRIKIAYPKSGGWRLSAIGGAGFWFSVKGEFHLDDGRALTIAQMLEAFRNRRGEYVPLGDGAFLRLSGALAKRLEALEGAGRVKDGALEVPPAAVPMLDGVFAGDDGGDGLALPDEILKRAEEVRGVFARRVEVPERLKAELRPYQREGYEWLSRLAACGFGACLADDMGLGKTLQVIALLLERAHEGASLVVAPASVCGNWKSEIARFAPTLRTFLAWEEKADEMESVAAAGSGDVVIAGYGLMVSREDAFAAREWNGVVLDEAQAVKNATSKRAHAVKRLKAKFRVAATGTPVENRLTELWSIFDFLNPGLLSTEENFTKRFTADGRATPQLKRLVSPMVLRRVKRDVLDDLPEKTEITLPVMLGADERDGYEACRRMALAKLEEGGMENRISILAELTRLRRYCCHPSLVLGNDAKVSAKMEALTELLASLRENRHRALVFSQFTDYLALVREMVSGQGWSHLYLDGSTPAAERGRLVEAFQRGEGDFFLISLKAGGTGLNLTAANYVILLDPWWNPAVENQAADRVHRIGQKNPVTVYRLIASDTVEEKVLELHAQKKSIADDMLEGNAGAVLTPEELLGLFGAG